MSAINEHLKKLREERVAREKARIEKLKEMNLKKYNKVESQPNLRPASSSLSVNKSVASMRNIATAGKNANMIKRPSTVPIKLTKDVTDNKRKSTFIPKTIKPFNTISDKVSQNKMENKTTKDLKLKIEPKNSNVGNCQKYGAKPVVSRLELNVRYRVQKTEQQKEVKPVLKAKEPSNLRKTLNFGFNAKSANITQSDTNKSANSRKSIAPPVNSRKSMLPTSAAKPNPHRQSVFERLYQPKIAPKKPIDDVTKLKTDPEYLKKMMKNAEMLINKRHTVFEQRKPLQPIPVRRSISAVHFKRISKSELSQCIHKWSSIGEKLNEIHLEDEDDKVKEDKVVSAVKSERKKVKFQTPVYNFNTPKPEELQSRLQAWLQKRGKSLNSFQHLQCFGIHHLPHKIKPLKLEQDLDYDEEDKENRPLENDSDNESFDDNMNDREKEIDDKNKWRTVSVVSESVDFNDTRIDITLTSEETPSRHMDELLLGALKDLTELLHEGFHWEQCARWLRALRSRFPSAPARAAYWECRAALEEARGDLPTSIHCWEEAMAKGTQHSVVEANLDQLLDKFMQLKISPSGGKKQVDPKMIDVKNIFKSTIIRFAVQQAKLRQAVTSPKYICTPVRRSARLSRADTPLVCSSLKQASQLGPVTFVPNDKLCGTP